MTYVVTDTPPRIRYTAAAGQTDFVIPYVFQQNDHIRLYKNGVLLTYSITPANSDEYSLTGESVTEGGTATIGAPGALLNDDILILRDIPVERLTDFQTTGTFDVPGLNEELDRLTAMIQNNELNYNNRVLHIEEQDSPEAIGPLPDKATRAVGALGFDVDGNPVMKTDYQDSVDDAAQSAAEAAASAAAAAASESNAATSETNAAASEAAAAQSAIDAQASADSITTDVADAEAAADRAEAARDAAVISETNAGASETAAGLSETNAETSETNAAASETNAGQSASNAATSETNAAASETAAGQSETNAAASAAAALASENAAETAADRAEAVVMRYGAGVVHLSTSGNVAELVLVADPYLSNGVTFDTVYLEITGGTAGGGCDVTVQSESGIVYGPETLVFDTPHVATGLSLSFLATEKVLVGVSAVTGTVTQVEAKLEGNI